MADNEHSGGGAKSGNRHMFAAAPTWALMLFTALAAQISNAVAQPAGVIQILPEEDTNAVLHNPDMGWVIYENYPLDPDPHGSSTMLTLPDDTFPEVDAVALMFSWQDVEHEPGVYDFANVDHAYDHWRKLGKEIQLRLSTESLMYWATRNPPAGKGVPDYVLNRLTPGEKQTRDMDGTPYVVVDARNPFYRERLAAFLGAVRQHFDYKRPVSLIDLRGFGAWGEWHSGFTYPDAPARQTALKGVLDTWSEALPQHMLALSFSYDPDGPKALYSGPYQRLEPACTTNYAEFLHFSAYDYALSKSNITWRRDGCGGAVHSNERKLNEFAFTTLHRTPMVSEFLGSYSSIKKGGSNWVSWVVEDALSLHPNYINVLGWQGGEARLFMRERPDLLAHGLRHMGYRLVPERIQCPSVLTNGVAAQVEFVWVNHGVGRALRDYQLQVLLVNEKRAVVGHSQVQVIPTTQWLPGLRSTIKHPATFSDVTPGRYELAFQLLDGATGGRIRIPVLPRRAAPLFGDVVVQAAP